MRYMFKLRDSCCVRCLDTPSVEFYTFQSAVCDASRRCLLVREISSDHNPVKVMGLANQFQPEQITTPIMEEMLKDLPVLDKLSSSIKIRIPSALQATGFYD